MRINPKMGIIAVTGLGLLAGCGETVGEQGLYGAAAGGATAAVLDGNILGGAVLGAGANILYCETNPGKCG